MSLASCGSLIEVNPGSAGGSSGAASSGTSDSTTGTPPTEPGTTNPSTSGPATSVTSAGTSGAPTGSSGWAESGSSGGGSTSTGGEDPVSVCDPQPEIPGLVMLLNESPLWQTKHLEFEGTCEIWNIEGNDGLWSLSFLCDPMPFVVGVSVPVAPAVALGDIVQLSLFVDSPWWGNGFVKVMRDGELQLAAMTSQALPIGGGLFPPSDFFAPLSVSVVAGVCDPEPVQGPDGGNFIEDPPCTQDVRLALAFELDDQSTTVFDRNTGSLGPLELYVGRTVSHVDVFCPDTPDGWREFAAVRP